MLLPSSAVQWTTYRSTGLTTTYITGYSWGPIGQCEEHNNNHCSSSTSRWIMVSCTFWIILKISTSWSSLFSFQCSDFGFIAYVTVYYYYCHVWWCTILSSLFFWCPCMAINNVNVQYNGGLLPDIILLTQGYYHRGTRLNVMKRFSICSLWSHLLSVLTIFPPDWGMPRRSRCVLIFLLTNWNTWGQGRPTIQLLKYSTVQSVAESNIQPLVDEL